MLMCSSCALKQSLTLLAAGVINNFMFAMIDYIWLSHTIILFWTVWFPVRSKNFKYYRYLHLTLIVLFFTLPWIPVAVAFGTGGYTLTSFPQFTNCFAANPDASFYPFILPKCFFYPTGITLILLTIRKLLKTNREQGSGNQVL